MKARRERELFFRKKKQMSIIQNYIKQQNAFIKNWHVDHNSVWEESVFSSLNSVREKIRPFIEYLPEPYVGNPLESNAVFLSYNPGPVIDHYQHKTTGTFVRNYNAVNDYHKFASDIIYFRDGNTFWKPRLNMTSRLTGIPEERVRIFGIEICPWHSFGFNMSSNDLQIAADHIHEHVLQVAEAVIEQSTIKVIISVGKNYYHLFQILGFEKVHETDNNSNEINWPLKPNGVKVIRNFSVWKSTNNVVYLNTFSPGSNKAPSFHFDGILKNLLEQNN
jgi:hypothetical protein